MFTGWFYEGKKWMFLLTEEIKFNELDKKKNCLRFIVWLIVVIVIQEVIDSL